MAAGAFEPPPRWAVRTSCTSVKHSDATAASPIDPFTGRLCPEVLRFATFSLQAMVRLTHMLLGMLRYARDRLLEFCDAPTEAPEELLNSGIGVLTREDASIQNPESLRNRSNSAQQLQKDMCTAELSPAIAKKGDLGMNHCLGVHLEEEKEVVYGRMDVTIKLRGILSKLEVSQDYALLARQVRQEGIPCVETLRGVTSLIFETAVMHPTQCSMYAQLCVHLSKELLDFPGDKTITFRSMLLTMCQEEFEKFTKLQPAVERDDEKEKRVELRKLGNITLIGELFNKKLLIEEIVHECIRELLGQDPKATPAEENVEVLCHFFRTVGKQLEERTKSKMALGTYFDRLKVIGESTALSSRIRQMVHLCVIDLRSKKWVSPQEQMKAKKINKIRAEAKVGLPPEMMALWKGRPAATPKLLPGAGGMAPGMSVVPSILGMPGIPGIPGILGGGGPVQLVDACRKASVDKEALLSLPVASDGVKVMEFGAGRVAAMPKLMVRDNFGVRANKDDFNLRGLLQRVQMFDK